MGGGHHSATGTYGSLTINPSSGEYTYTLDTAKNGAADKLGLNADGTPQTGTDTFTIYVRDEHGAWSEQTITITVNGSNDAPVIAKTENTLTVTESGFKADNTAVDTTHDVSKGSVNATDVDTSDQGKLTYYFSDKAHNPVTFGKGDVIGHLTLADGTKTEITVTSSSSRTEPSSPTTARSIWTPRPASTRSRRPNPPATPPISSSSATRWNSTSPSA